MIMALALIGFWLLAWGDASLVNVLSGAALATLLLVAFPRRRFGVPRVRVDPLGVVRLVLHILRQLVVSTALVAREVVSRRSHMRAGVIAYPMQDGSAEVMSTLANAIALTPGTMTVEATTDPAVVYVHFLLLDDVEQARRQIGDLERLVIAALHGGRNEITKEPS